MSGHSKWAQIKHKKALVDAKKGNVFSKISRLISIAARGQEGDPITNVKLRQAIAKAKEVNMPSDNIERAIKKGTAREDYALEEFLYEAYGPGGVAILIEGITDNKNRTSNEIKHLLLEHNAKLAEPGSVAWAFEKISTDGVSEWSAKEYAKANVNEEDKKNLLKLFEALDENDDVQEIYSNFVES